MEARRTPAWSLGSAARIAGAVCALGLGACQQVQVRAVVHDRPLVSTAALETEPLRLPPARPQGEWSRTGFEQDAPAIEGRIEPVEGEPLRPVRAAQAVDLDGVDHRSGDRAERYLRAGIARALEEAGIRPEAWGDRRIETIFGTTLGGMQIGRAHV